MTNHPDPGFGGVCPRPEGGAYCTICGLCLDHCQCKRASKTNPTDLNEGGRVGLSGAGEASMTDPNLIELKRLHDTLAVRDCGAGGPWDQEPIAWAIREMERLKHRLKDQNVVCRDRQTEIEQLRAALKVARQALLEFTHAQEEGPSWYTRGESGMYAQVRLWLRRGTEAINAALGPYDDNGQYEKEKPAAEQEGVLTIVRDVTTVSPNFKLSVAVSEAAPQPQRYFTHADLLELPADAELDEFGRYDGNEVVYLASAIDREQR